MTLARGIDAGIESAEAFFASYRDHPAGIPHRLILLAKGWDSVPGRDRLGVLALQHDATIIDLPDDGFDWGAYMRAVPQIREEWICFLNSHSRILVDGWLGHLRVAAEGPDVGAAGATGSWGTLLQNFRIISEEVADYARRRGLAMALVYAAYVSTFGGIYHYLRQVREFAPFPNPCLRSNVFCLRRDIFMDFSNQFSIPVEKRHAFIMECGRKGLTHFLASKGRKVVVAGADGLTYGPNEWLASKTFRVPNQPNLLVADNQTRNYEEAKVFSRRVMERAAWGRSLTALAS